MVRALATAGAYSCEKPVSRTEAVRQLLATGGRLIEVVFLKRDGSRRVLHGRLVGSDRLRGRSYCEDLTLPAAALRRGRLRLVDHRTLLSVTVDGTRYVVR